MKWLIASDIHGSAYYCEKLLERFREERADKILLLGDILYHGPRNALPKEYDAKRVIDMLNPLADRIFCVRGNCDAEVDQMVLKFPMLSDYAIFEHGGKMIFATHGHIYNEENLPHLHKGDVLLHGHFHVPACVEHKIYVYMNPGSVSIPKDGSENGYMTFEDGTFLWKNIEGKNFMEYKI